MATPEPTSIPDSRTDVSKRKQPNEWLEKCLDPEGDGLPHPNVAELLEDEELDRIGQRVIREYDIDKISRADWESMNEKGMVLARQVLEVKNTPWANASSVKYPLITTAAIQFAARAYPEIVQGSEIVKCRVLGKDPDNTKQEIAKRISEHMSWQLLEEMDGWEEETDKLLHVLPVAGMCFRKTYFDNVEKKNRSDLCLADDVVIHYKAKNMYAVRRITHCLEYYQNDVYERIARGIWLDQELPRAEDAEHPGEEDAPYQFLEQHRYLDLDGDGYEEPYVVTCHKELGKIVRIVPRFEAAGIEMDEQGKLIRIKPVHFFTKFGFIPAPDGSIYDIGFGILLYPINESINVIMNQLIDAGSLANLQSGWVDKALREKGGVKAFRPGEWKKTENKLTGGRKLSDMIAPLPVKEPSNVLFEMLGLLIDAGEKIGTVKDILTGSPPGANVPATTVLAMIEQGLKVFSAIYKRTFRSMGDEYQKLFALNAVYMDPEKYFRLQDTENEVGIEDYNTEELDVVPVADPTMSSDVQRIAKAQAIAETVSGRANVDEDEITTRLISSISVPDPDKLMVPEEQRNLEEPPDPMMMLKGREIFIQEQRLEMDKIESVTKIEEMTAKIGKMHADAILSVAKAEAEEIGPQLQQYAQQVQQLGAVAKQRIQTLGQIQTAEIAQKAREKQNAASQQGGSGTVAAGGGNSGTSPTGPGGV